MIPTLNKSPNFDRIMAAETKIVACEGSTGSSKTYSFLQVLLVHSFMEENKTYSCVRETLPAHKKGAMKDWKDILNHTGVGHVFGENKTDRVWTNNQTGTRIEFFSLDQSGSKKGQGEHGARRDRLYVNEVPGVSYEAYRQLAKRTRGQIFLDWNPKMLRHWVYDNILTRDDCTYIHSTYKDNPFISEGEVREIEADVPVYEEADGTRIKDWNLDYEGTGTLVSGDPYHWAVYGLGRRGSPSEAIYPICGVSHTLPADTVYGLDFGFNHPTVLLEVGYNDVEPRAELHFDQLIHESGLTSADLIATLESKEVDKRKPMYCDGARPEVIEELKRAGYLAKPADKSPGSVYAGIQWVKGHTLLFTPRSQKSKEQFQDYRWQKKPDDTVDDKPVKLNDDAPDAGRYGAYTHWNKPQMDYSRA